MRRWRGWLLWALASQLGLAAEPAAPKQGAGRPGVGEWVTFRMAGEGREAFLRLAVVGEGPAGGPCTRWLELEVGDHPSLEAPLGQLKVLVRCGLGPPEVLRLGLARGLEPAAELEGPALAWFVAAANRPMASPASGRPDRPRMVWMGEAALPGRAGLSSASVLEVRGRGAALLRVWVSPAVPVLGLARLERPGSGQVLQVEAFGWDAKGRISLAPIAPASSPEGL